MQTIFKRIKYFEKNKIFSKNIDKIFSTNISKIFSLVLVSKIFSKNWRRQDFEFRDIFKCRQDLKFRDASRPSGQMAELKMGLERGLLEIF